MESAWLPTFGTMKCGNDGSESRQSIIKLPHDKTNNVVVRPAKTQISLGICPV